MTVLVKKRREVLKWLAFLDQKELHRDHSVKRSPGTGHDFLEGYYKRWLDSGHPSLWLYGDGMLSSFNDQYPTDRSSVGCGKTKLL